MAGNHNGKVVLCGDRAHKSDELPPLNPLKLIAIEDFVERIDDNELRLMISILLMRERQGSVTSLFPPGAGVPRTAVSSPPILGWLWCKHRNLSQAGVLGLDV